MKCNNYSFHLLHKSQIFVLIHFSNTVSFRIIKLEIPSPVSIFRSSRIMSRPSVFPLNARLIHRVRIMEKPNQTGVTCALIQLQTLK